MTAVDEALRVGTCGWQYDSWRAAWYPPEVPHRQWLDWYATQFDTVEIDSSFYRLPTRAAAQHWRDAVPDGFLFAPKMSRYLTHVRRLTEPNEPIARFLDRLEPLDGTLGPTLLQLPPSLPCDVDRLEGVLRAWPRGRPLAVEFRHPSWFEPPVRRALERAGAATCLTDRRGRPQGPLWATADWTYLRFHEGRAESWPHYGDRNLDRWLDRLDELDPPVGDRFAYFNNDQNAAAPRDARRLLLRAQRRARP